MGVNASPAGLKVAIAKAKAIDADLMWERFTWEPHLKGKDKPAESVGEWVGRYEKDHWEHTQRNPTKENSFHKNYRLYFQKIPQDLPLTVELLRETIVSKSQPESRNREFYCMAYRRLAEFVGRKGAIAPEMLEAFTQELRRLKQGYESEQILSDQLPTDQQILEIWEGIKNPGWKWVYGMLATYGLRPSEVFRLDLGKFSEKTEALRVLKNTKTGARITYPCLPSWREEFKLWEVSLPKIQRIEERTNNELTEKVGWQFYQLKIPHSAKDLRHAWCIRTALEGVPDSIAARWAGHSLAVHSKTYHQAISESQHQSVFDRMKAGKLRQP
ncbi:hypothetical protein [Leptolyngbya sp. FACHB-16]|uniref:hypothetical protein n=1 Tax=unclassified Leptolyngbya TaxID=2650499 RepID=UPI001688F793|nr:hypothetical protein [Leptolyngbya sp. FACHB-16]MBD2156294.1 hypothetical protein [Leptolyngbya sp. FACHB-16]